MLKLQNMNSSPTIVAQGANLFSMTSRDSKMHCSQEQLQLRRQSSHQNIKIVFYQWKVNTQNVTTQDTLIDSGGKTTSIGFDATFTFNEDQL